MQAGDRREIYHYDRGRLTTRTVEYTQDPEGKTYTYRYDAQGNTLGDGENTYLYDCLNRIAEVQTKAGDIQKNHYDAEGLRSQMEENGKLVSFQLKSNYRFIGMRNTKRSNRAIKQGQKLNEKNGR